MRASIGRLDGDAKAQGAPIGDDDVAGALGRMADRQDLEASAVEGVGGVGDLDHLRTERRWVLEGGIMLLSRLIKSAMNGS